MTIVKSRGTAHSKQVRELILSRQGITLADVYTAEGQVLMGTLRWQKECADRLALERQQRDLEVRAQAIASEREELRARLVALRTQLELKVAQLAQLQQVQVGHAEAERVRLDMFQLRSAPGRAGNGGQGS